MALHVLFQPMRAADCLELKAFRRSSVRPSQPFLHMDNRTLEPVPSKENDASLSQKKKAPEATKKDEKDEEAEKVVTSRKPRSAKKEG